MSDNTKARFATTSWSLVVTAGRSGKDSGDWSASGDQALTELCGAYWYPVYAYLRRKGMDGSSAEELTQAFFTELLEKKLVSKADQNRGRFRTFLLTSLENFAKNLWRKENAVKRGGRLNRLSLDFEDADRRYNNEPSTDLTPDKVYERNWALQVLAQAKEELLEQYAKQNKQKLCEALLPYLTPQENPDYPSVGKQLDLSAGAVKVAVHRLRNRYGQKIRSIIASTVEDPKLVDDELSRLLTALSFG